MTSQQPIRREEHEEHQVLKFVPRSSRQSPPQVLQSRSFVHGKADIGETGDFAHFENRGRSQDEPDDFHHRMLANTAAFALTVALTGVGIWLAVSLANLRNTQDCVLMGRRDCARIVTPQR
jgi:hypothetical protein